MTKIYSPEELNSFSRETLVAVILSMQDQLAQLNTNMERLIEQIASANNHRYGRSSEKLDVIAGQLELELIFNEAEALTETLYVVEPAEEDVIQVTRRKKKGKREEDLKDLPVEVIPHTLPEEKLAKYGMTTEQILEAYKILKSKGAKEFGLHAFLASNTVTNDYYPMLAKVLFEQAVRLSKEAGVHIKFINLSGGIGIPYRPDQEPNDIRAIGEGVRKVYEEVLVPAGMGDVAIYTELGRYMMGPYGCLVTKAIHEKHTHKDYIGVDACAVNLMRPAMYGAYHHITVLGKEDAPCSRKYDVTGSLCENNDKFAIDRMLPEIEIGDYLVIHDTGAHGFAMGYNYNGKLKSAELLLKEDGSVQLIRRAEKPSDYFATFDCFEIGKKLLGK